MLGGLAGFYLIFFTFLYRRARFVSRSISQPLAQIERMAHRIAVGEYEQALPAFGVSEFRHTVGELQQMGRLLGDSNRARETAEARLTERNEELSTILSLSPDGLVSFDASGIVTETNPAFLSMTGWTRDELIGRSWTDFWARLRGQSSAGSQQALVEPILRLLRPRPVALECRVVGAPAGAQVAYFRDITRADELDRTKSRFLATAAHELRTPIAVISGYTEFLQARDPPAGERVEILATMRRHGDQIAGIVSELLDLARIEARAGRDFTMIRQPLAAAVRRFIESFVMADDARVPSICGDIGDAEVFMDADKFCQALGNVLANACKYSPAGTPVSVRLVGSDAEVGVEVQRSRRGHGRGNATPDLRPLLSRRIGRRSRWYRPRDEHRQGDTGHPRRADRNCERGARRNDRDIMVAARRAARLTLPETNLTMPGPAISMVARAGSSATISREPRQARKGATVAAASGAGGVLARAASIGNRGYAMTAGCLKRNR